MARLIIIFALAGFAGALHRSQGDDDKEEVVEEWVRPFSIINGACEHVDAGEKEKSDRHVMNIRQVGGGAFYLGEIGFGTPEQTLNMLLDTGSDEIVIKTNDCKGCEGRGYNVAKSSTWVEENFPDDPKNGMVNMSYGSGDVTGQRGWDTVHTGPLSGPHMPLVRVLSSNIDMFEDMSEDALEVILGMAPGLREYAGERLASAMKVRRFTQCLPNNANEDGMFVLNDAVPEGQNFNGPYNSVGQYYWAAGIQNFRFEWSNDGSKAPIELAKPFVGIIDTGTTLLSLPRDVMDLLEVSLGSIEHDCSRMWELPDLMFEIDGHTHVLPPKAYVAESPNEYASLRRLQKSQKMYPHLNFRQHLEILSDAETTEMAGATADLYFKKPFLNLKRGKQCMLLFTEPLDMNSPQGELGILGMAFFREYAIHFDFCSRQMWTSRSYGDCSGNIGQHPDNVDFCADQSWLNCFGQGLKDFFTYVGDGIANMFGGKKKEEKEEKKKARFTMAGEENPVKGEHYEELFQLDPKAIRQSEAAKWLTNTLTDTGSIEI